MRNCRSARTNAAIGAVIMRVTLVGFGCQSMFTVSSRDLDRKVNARLIKKDPAAYAKRHYTKAEYRVPMRDGVTLFTSVYSPRDTTRTYPILLVRTPYSVRPYGSDEYTSRLLPAPAAWEEGFIFVFQDVRGKQMSEGEFVNMRPHNPNKRTATDVDESSDTYDAIEWLVSNIDNNNGKVGQWGISYPGFYTAAGMIDAHPALVASSPQAPIADWFFDDFYHHGAFFLPHCFNFFASFGLPREGLTTERNDRFDHGTPDGYQFFLDVGPLKNLNDEYLHDEVAFWNEILQHPTRDAFWQARDLTPHLKNVSPNVMTVGGWYDAEDLYGTFATYRATEAQNPNVNNRLVIGPWRHGGWARDDGSKLGNIHFSPGVSDYFTQQILLPFWRHTLKGAPDPNLPEAVMYETGANQWRTFDQWPPAARTERSLYLTPGGMLSWNAPTPTSSGPEFDQYISDPAKPVPYTETINTGMTRAYMTDDQRFAARRPDVLTYTTNVFDKDMTLAGPMTADLWVSTSGTDSDFVVKLIDIFPPDAEDFEGMEDGQHLGNYHMMVRSEAFRARYRNSYENPEPFVPDEPTHVTIRLQDVLHTFKKGHKMQVQIQSTWFPMMDRNPQTFVKNIFFADEEDFVKATQRVYGSARYPSTLKVGVLERK